MLDDNTPAETTDRDTTDTDTTDPETTDTDTTDPETTDTDTTGLDAAGVEPEDATASTSSTAEASPVDTNTSTPEAFSADSPSDTPTSGTASVRRRRAAGRPAGPPAATFSAAPNLAATATPPAAPPAATDSGTSLEALADTGDDEHISADVADVADVMDVTADTPPGAPDGVASVSGDAPPVARAVSAPVFQAPSGTARPRRRAASRPAGSPATPVQPSAPAVPVEAPEAPSSADNATSSDTSAADTIAESPAEITLEQRPATPDMTSTTVDAAGPEAVDEAINADAAETPSSEADGEDSSEGAARRRRRRGGRRRRRSSSSQGSEAGTDSAEDSTQTSPTDGDARETADGDTEQTSASDSPDTTDESGLGTSASSRRRRRRRRRGEETVASEDDPANTTVRVRERKAAEDEITSVHGSTRLEAKKQRRREGRDAGRRRVPVISEAEFLARREAVDREMVVRRRGDLMQIAVLEDKILAEHYVARGSETSLIGNIYLGRVQNVLPSMEAAFIDIGRGRNAVLYAGEVDWKAFSGEGKPRRIEEVLSSGQSVLVQVTKDPVGNKGARLTSQVSLAGRFLVYVPGGHTSGISRKLPDTERSRLKSLLKDIVPAEAGVIVRTAAEGATEEQLTHDVAALTARWDDVNRKATGQGPKLLYAEPDLMIKVIRDLYNEDFKGLTVQGDDAWEDVQSYVEQVAPDLGERLHHWDDERDVFAAYRLDEQIAKGTDRKVWLPSGGSLVIDRTEAMTVVDVNTGKFTGSGGNLEETVTKNNLEAAEEIVRQLRLRDIGGIIVIDFIDMVLEDNRDLVLRRLVECLGRDRTRHQVAEVTSLGLVQMTRKRIGTGLLEAFTEICTHCQGRGFHVLNEPVLPDPSVEDAGAPRGRESGRSRGGRAASGRSLSGDGVEASPPPRTPPIDPRLRPKPQPPEPTPESGEPESGESAGFTHAVEVTGAAGLSAHDELEPVEPGAAVAQAAAGAVAEDSHAAVGDGALTAASGEAASGETASTHTALTDTALTDTTPTEILTTETAPETPTKPKRARRSRAKSAADKPAVDGPVAPVSNEPPVDG